MTAELKQQAQQIYKVNYKQLLLFTLVYVLLSTGLSFIPKTTFVVVNYLIDMLSTILGTVFFTGYLYVLFQIKLGNRLKSYDIFLFYTRKNAFLKSIGIAFIINIPYIFSIVTQDVLLDTRRIAYGIIFALVIFVFMITLVYLSLRLYLSEYLLARDQTISIKQILTISFQSMKGNIFKLIGLVLSFFLYGCLLGIPAVALRNVEGLIWVIIFNVLSVVLQVFFFPYYYLTLIYFAESICPKLEGGTPMNTKKSEFMDYEEDDLLSKMYDTALHITQTEPIVLEDEEGSKQYDEELYDELYEEYGEEFFDEEYLNQKQQYEESETEQAEREKFESNIPLTQNELTYQFEMKSIADIEISNLLRKTKMYRFLRMDDEIQSMIEKAVQKSINDYRAFSQEDAVGSAAEDLDLNKSYFRVITNLTKQSDLYRMTLTIYINE